MAAIRMWAIRRCLKNGDHELSQGTVARTRSKAIKEWLSYWSPDRPTAKWSHWYRRGHRAVRVEVKEIES